jgi:hypothetical protein
MESKAIVIKRWRMYVNNVKKVSEVEADLKDYKWLNADGDLVIDEVRLRGVDIFAMMFGIYFRNIDKMLKEGEKA